jgi:hypothetical protein
MMFFLNYLTMPASGQQEPAHPEREKSPATCFHEIHPGVGSTGQFIGPASGKIALDDSFNGRQDRASSRHRAAAGNDPT